MAFVVALMMFGLTLLLFSFVLFSSPVDHKDDNSYATPASVATLKIGTLLSLAIAASYWIPNLW